MQVVCGTTVEERCARYDSVLVPAIRERYGVSGDARLGFELEAPNPHSRLAQLPATGVLELVRSCVDECCGPVLIGRGIMAHHKSQIYCRQIEQWSAWKEVCSFEAYTRDICCVARNQLYVYNPTCRSELWACDVYDRRGRHLRSGSTVYWSQPAHVVNINYAQTITLAQDGYRVFTRTSDIATMEVVLPSPSYNCTVQIMRNGMFLQINRYTGQLEYYMVGSTVEKWNNCFSTAATEIYDGITLSASDETGNLFYASEFDQLQCVLAFKDIREPTPIRTLSAVRSVNISSMGRMVAYNGGSDLVCGSGSSWHYSVRASRWTGLTCAGSEMINVIGILDRPYATD
jgi:hypothetical protein